MSTKFRDSLAALGHPCETVGLRPAGAERAAGARPWGELTRGASLGVFTCVAICGWLLEPLKLRRFKDGGRPCQQNYTNGVVSLS